jgi:hypothetical protein
LVTGYTETTNSDGIKKGVFNADDMIIWCINSELESSILGPIDFLTETQDVPSLKVVMNSQTSSTVELNDGN